MMRLPEGFDYATLPMLSNEEVQKLSASRPATLNEAAKISGVTPASLVALMQHLHKQRGKGKRGGGGGGKLAGAQHRSSE
jgi:tRNA uridine 5-carboxymethylaminomethyl modification enzyme